MSPKSRDKFKNRDKCLLLHYNLKNLKVERTRISFYLTNLHAHVGCFQSSITSSEYRRVGAFALQCTRLSMSLCHNLHQGFIFPFPLICPSMVALICMSPYRHALTKWPHLHIFFSFFLPMSNPLAPLMLVNFSLQNNTFVNHSYKVLHHLL